MHNILLWWSGWLFRRTTLKPWRMGSDFGLNGFLRFPRTSLLELLLPEATLDSRSSLLPTLLRKPRNSVPNREGRLCVISQCVLSFWSLFLVSHVFSTLHVCWVVQGSDVPKHAQTWLTFAHVKVSLYWSNLSTHIALQIAPYHIPSCDLISYHDMTLMILNEYTYIYIYILISHDILILPSCAFNLWPCFRMVWREAPGESGPTLLHAFENELGCRPDSNWLTADETWRPTHNCTH